MRVPLWPADVNVVINWSSLGIQTKPGLIQNEGRATTHIPSTGLSCALPVQWSIHLISLDNSSKTDFVCPHSQHWFTVVKNASWLLWRRTSLGFSLSISSHPQLLQIWWAFFSPTCRIINVGFCIQCWSDFLSRLVQETPSCAVCCGILHFKERIFHWC